MVVDVIRPGSLEALRHGGPDWDHSYLLRPINQLATARRIVLFDIRGCGRSTRGLPSRAYQPVEVVKDLDVLTASLGVPEVDLRRHRFGVRYELPFRRLE